MKILKPFLLSLLTFNLLMLLGVLILLRFPTTPSRSTPFTFAPRPDFENLPPDLKVTVLETGHQMAPEAFISRKGSLFRKKKMSHSAILVEHPQEMLLIDGGLGTNIDQEMARAPWLTRTLLGNYTTGTPLIQQEKLKGKLDKIDSMILTHAHWDHLSGALDFPNLRIRMPTEELDHATQIQSPYRMGIFPEQIQQIKNQVEAIQFTDGPYENFSNSLDLFGDGSIVLVPLPGHTPGSTGIFINLAPDRRFLIVGDAAWSVNAHGKPETRSFLAELVSDHNREQARETRRQLGALVDHSNEIILVPIHDPQALAKLTPATP